MARMIVGRWELRWLRLGAAAMVLTLAALGWSAASALAKGEAPVVTHQPQNTAVGIGQHATFEATASGSPTPTVQWEMSSNSGSTWTPISGATSTTYTIASAGFGESGREFRATFKNTSGTVSSEAAKLTVEIAPVIVHQPVATFVPEGQNATFEAAATGVPTPTVQWERSTDGGATWGPIAGATATRLTLTAVTLAETGYRYRATFTNPLNSVTSSAATLTVGEPPVVTVQPLSATIVEGQGVTFEAVASGMPTPSEQWEVSSDGGSTWSAIEGASGPQLTLPAPTSADTGKEFRASFSNIGGSAVTQAATLTVVASEYGLAGWGSNSSGELGIGSALQANSPMTVPLDFVTAVAAGQRFTLVLLANGTVMSMGTNISGQLGDGLAGSSQKPVHVGELTHVKAIAAGTNHGLALLENGTVMAWGNNESGQLGNGGGANKLSPIPVPGLSGVTAIAAGGEYSLALLENGTVMAWGNNEFGQLGDGKTTNSNVPVAVPGLSGVTAIDAGTQHVLALLSDGTVSAWGHNQSGQLGNPSVTEQAEKREEEDDLSDVPVPVVGLSEVTALAAGQRHSLALHSDGTVSAWGGDQEGELGTGSFEPMSEVPTTVLGLSGVSAIAAGGEHSMALLESGTVMVWGEAKHGELGNGTTGPASAVPVAVPALGEVAGIAAGGFDDFSIGAPTPTVTALSPNAGGVSGGTTVTISGHNFTGASAVRFGALAASSFTVNSAGSITAVAPPGSTGTVDVTVTTPAGTSSVVVGDRFSYQLGPAIKKLSSKSGPATGGTSVTITGTGFTSVTAVSFGSTPATSFTVTSPTTITAVAPSGAGIVDVTVTTTSGTSGIVKTDVFSYSPVVTGVSPSSGPVAGKNSVTVSGAGFLVGSATTSFKFGKKKATEVQCSSSVSCTMVAPAQPAATVEVIATAGKAKGIADAPFDQYTYE